VSERFLASLKASHFEALGDSIIEDDTNSWEVSDLSDGGVGSNCFK